MAYPYFLRCAYVGTGFSGFQIQSTLRSVQGDLWKALRTFEPGAPMPQGTGRTDAGVHAKAQGVLVQLGKAWDPYRLLAAFNAHLAPDVRIMAVLPAPEGFFPRAHAVAKRYVYRLQEGPAADPFLHQRRWHVHGAQGLDRAAMAEACGHLRGVHDFSSFRHQECAALSPVKEIYAIRMEGQGPALDLVFEGNRFLMHMVRILTGTIVEVGKGRFRAQDMPAVLEARDRARAGITAPPHGLYLEEVWYQKRWGILDPSPWPEEPPRD
ncbi:tRNA pseudouridine synthase A [Mesoterricola silvestris]|uniref:tRNA pseudouridine synthase A n=1 Tax=Mesoterricola silvestris TaxID=2927979 RepID=A0AA48GQ57_9BACT|nr:tRNA pseudouridine synthase A [Mesoterricola silvestris]BDU72150.1 tRNA pseudouridine synthase A [Mesoterricola silvestris]